MSPYSPYSYKSPFYWTSWRTNPYTSIFSDDDDSDYENVPRTHWTMASPTARMMAIGDRTTSALGLLITLAVMMFALGLNRFPGTFS
jgi:hypothetical protein